MPTPAVNGAASIIQRTGGLFRPYSSEASKTAFVALSGLSEGAGVKPRSCISRHATAEHDEQDADAEQERHAERGRLRDHAARDRAAEHRDAADDLPAPEHRLEAAVVAGVVERVDEPRLDRARRRT